MPLDNTSIAALVVRTQKGDRDAFHDLVIDLQDEVRLFVAARTSAHDVVEEVVQSTFVTAWEHCADYQPHGSFTAWLKGIARHRLYAEVRQRARSGRAAQLDTLVATAADQADTAETGSALAPELTRLRHCLERLPARSRTMLERRYLGNVPLPQLAQQFKQSVEALASLLQRVRKIVRTCVEAGSAQP